MSVKDFAENLQLYKLAQGSAAERRDHYALIIETLATRIRAEQSDQICHDLVPEIWRILKLPYSSDASLIAQKQTGDFQNPDLFHTARHGLFDVPLATYMIAKAQDSYLKQKLSDEEIAVIMLAALGHDLKHDGRGNTIDGVHYPCRLEKSSLLETKNRLSLNVIYDHKTILETSILGTNVSGSTSMASLVRYAHDLKQNGFYGLRYNKKPEKIITEHNHQNVLLNIFLKRPRLALLAAIVQDADVLLGSVNVIRAEDSNRRLAAEMGWQATPQGQISFYDKLLRGRYTTPAANDLAQIKVCRSHFQKQVDAQNKAPSP